MTRASKTDQTFISKITEIILANLENDEFGVKDLAVKYGISASGLNRRLQKTANKNINQFIREVRLRKALELLKKGGLSSSEVAFKVGFGSPAYFTKCFREYFGYLPGRVKEQGNEISNENEEFSDMPREEHRKSAIPNFSFRSIGGLLLVSLTLAVFILVFLKILRGNTKVDPGFADERISIAVMPFQNLTNDTIWNIWQTGIQTSLINFLTASDELKIRQLESTSELLRSKDLTDNASITPSVAIKASRKLKTDFVINGSIIEAGPAVRINARIYDTDNADILKSFEIEYTGNGEMFFAIIDSLKQQVKNFLIISRMIKEEPDIEFNSTVANVTPEYLRLCISGDKAFVRLDYTTAIEMYSLALEIDSALPPLYGAISKAYYNQDNYAEAKKWCLKYYRMQDIMDLKEKISANFWYTFLFSTPNESIRYAKQYISLDEMNANAYYRLGGKYLIIGQYDKAIQAFEKSLEVYKELDIKPAWIGNYSELGEAYHKTGNFKKEKKLYRKAKKDFPDDPLLVYQQAILAVSLGDTAATARYISKCKSNWNEQLWPEARMATNLANIFSEGGMPDKAEEYYREALSLEPENPVRMKNLGYFLTDRERNIEEGLELINRALKIEPDNYEYLHLKGWGLYKQGKNAEAMELLLRADSLKPIYNHLLYLHLQEAGKVAASIK